MNEPVWLDTDIVLAIHGETLAMFGGASGACNRGVLESALARPLNRHAYGERDLVALAAAYAFGLARGHAFVDGNKRIAFAALLTFLGLNGLRLRVEPAGATASMLSLAAGEIDEVIFAQWVRDHVVPRGN